jgi:cytoskeleton protein RodZ
LPSFGEKLKLAREKRKITLDQVSSTTKIGTRMLQALEEEKFSQLPGGIFNKGFVRAYARVVGLDEDQAVADYLLASGETPPAKPDSTARDGATRDTASHDAARDEGNRLSRLEAISDDPSRPLPWGAFAIILLIIALLLSLWSHRRREQERQDARPVPTGTKTSVQPREAATQQAAAISQNGATQASTPPSSSLMTMTRASANPTSRDQASPEDSAPATQTSSVAPAPSPGEFLVLIHAREESWISVSVDGKLSGSELLEPGSERTFHAHSRVFVKAGNSGALDFQLDGKKLDVGGAYGEVESITIGHAGLIPTASTTPTTP